MSIFHAVEQEIYMSLFSESKQSVNNPVELLQ